MIIQIFLIIILSVLTVIVIGWFYSNHATVKITDNAIDLIEVLPIQCIEDNYIINGNGDLTIGYKLFLPEVFQLTPERAQVINERLDELLKQLPKGTVIHQQSFVYTYKHENLEHSDNILMNENLKHFDGKEMVNCYVNIYFTFLNLDKKKSCHNPQDNSLLRKLNLPFSQPFKDYENRKKELDLVILSLENTLMSIQHFTVVKMKAEDLNNAVYDFVNMTFDKPTQDATKETVDPICTEDGILKIGNKFVSILSLNREGEKLVDSKIPTSGRSEIYGKAEVPNDIRLETSMTYPLVLGLPFDHAVNVIIEVTDSDETTTQINRNSFSNNFLANFLPSVKMKQEEQKLFCDTIARYNYTTTYTVFNVVIKDTDLFSLNRKISLAKQGFSYMNKSTAWVENAETANLFFSCIPGNARAVYRGIISTTIQSICYLTKENLYVSGDKGNLYLDRFGRIIRIDFWNYPGLANRNSLTIGESGSGKSFTENNASLQGFVQGGHMIIIDIGGSYRSLVELNNGLYYDSSKREMFSFNPFLCPTDLEGEYVYINKEDEDSEDDLIETVVAILSFIWKGDKELTVTERNKLVKSIRAFYENINKRIRNKETTGIFPDMNTYRAFLLEYYEGLKVEDKQKFDALELCENLEEYTGEGSLSYLLNAREKADIDNDRLIAFDLEKAKSKPYFPIIVLLCLQLVNAKISRLEGVRKELLIDEALDFLMDKKFGKFIAYLFRTFRKKNGRIAIAAQNVEFINKAPSEIKDSILINCATRIVLDHSQHLSDLDGIQKVLTITDAERKMIESMDPKKYEQFMKIGNDAYILRDGVSPFTAAAYDSRQENVVKLRKLFKNNGGSTYLAIQEFLALNKK